MSHFQDAITQILRTKGIDLSKATLKQRYEAMSRAAMQTLPPDWMDTAQDQGKRIGYFSAEFLIGRVIHANLYNLGLLEEAEAFLSEWGHSIADFEAIDDAAFGNGGLGRLAACFLDSAATQGIPLDGYGIRYQYGLFKQGITDGFQTETADDWERFGDPWSIRREACAVTVHFRGQSVRAVPYDMPVIGQGGKVVNVLRLWKAEAQNGFDFARFNEGEYDLAVAERTRAEELCAVLYPNDNTQAGKILRLKQEYFFSSASLQSIVARYVATYGDDFSKFPEVCPIQLNDTHPTVSIPELLRIFMHEHKLSFDVAFDIVRQTFAFTNHTVMAEALEQWDVALFCDVLPEVYPYIVMIENHLERELMASGIREQEAYQVIRDGRIQMANLAVYGSHSTNGVSALHTSLLKADLFAQWHKRYPERIQNKTNGVSQRRWLELANPELSAFITERIGDAWRQDLYQLDKLKPFANDESSLTAFEEIKREKKRQLAEYVQKREGVDLNTDFMLYSLCKRLHEYKRQLLDAFSLLDLYFRVKDGEIAIRPAVFLYGGKAAPGYDRAKGIIKFINEIAAMINTDPQMKGLMQVIFVQNYNVSYAEKIFPATDVSVQISAVGTEASGTGNMKMMLNGAVTLGTRDGANVEIVEQAGEENNYMFGYTVDQIKSVAKDYNPMAIYEQSPRLKRVVDTLIDGTFFDGGSGIFREIYNSLLYGASWHKPDHYYVLLDFAQYADAKYKVNRDYQDTMDFARKALLNTASAGYFSSDNTIRAYAAEIWGMGKAERGDETCAFISMN